MVNTDALRVIAGWKETEKFYRDHLIACADEIDNLRSSKAPPLPATPVPPTSDER